MLRFRVTVPGDLTDDVLEIFRDETAVSSLALLRGASLRPQGDVVTADVAREAANEIVECLERVGAGERGTIQIDPVTTWVSKHGLASAKATPGAGVDAVVWAEVTQRAHRDSTLTWTYLAFMTLATLIASIAIVLDSQILVIGAMVLGPEFLAIAALGLALVRRKPTLFRSATTTLVVGFAVAIVVAAIASLAARGLGWVVVADVIGRRPETDFIYTPTKWSFIVALIAAAAGVLSLTSAKVGGLSGVFISVTTIPAAGNIALASAFGQWSEVGGSAVQLALNVSGMVLAGWLVLAVQQSVWNRMGARRRKRLARI